AIVTDGVAAAIVADHEAEFVVEPDARGRGHGTAMLERIVADHDGPGGALRIWAHGDHPAARALAASHGLTPVRELLQLRASVPAVSATVPASTATTIAAATTGLTAFRPGLDDAAWLELNARAFSFHPEQGSVSQADLDELKREPWFDPEDFLVLRDGDTMIGCCWLKIEDRTVGEFYVVGVLPERQGEGLGRRLVQAGLARLAARGIRTASLYVEADNAPALALYRSFGFTRHSIDIQYEL
ncbi:MAG TPA: mycothiol synthase, partial [Lacisediminihabitans sp.]|uniref:mycothiol synthase n=1 Tax=Lacisediminihabitans sp. TaxID=2787631 RepID=UPI002EDA8CF8